MSDFAVVAEKLTRTFGSFRAVDAVDFTVERGEIFGFLGANGAGKTTTIRILCGLLRPSAGRCEVDGVDVGAKPEEVKRRIGYMSQKFSLYEDLSVAENFRFFGGVYGMKNGEIAERRGELVSLGMNDAVVNLMGVRFSGYPAWLLWNAVHLLKLVGLKKQLQVALDWSLATLFPRDTSILRRPARCRLCESGASAATPR